MSEIKPHLQIGDKIKISFQFVAATEAMHNEDWFMAQVTDIVVNPDETKLITFEAPYAARAYAVATRLKG